MSSRSMSAVNSRTLNKVVLFNTRLSKFNDPPVRTGNVYVEKNLYIAGDVSINGNITTPTTLNVVNFNATDANVSNVLTAAQAYITSIYATSINANQDIICSNLNASGVITSDNYLPGQVVRMSMLSAADMGFTINANVSSSTYANIITFSFTPTYQNSYLVFDFNTKYTVSGDGADTFNSQITVNDTVLGNPTSTVVGTASQQWGATGGSGSGTRSGTMFPLTGRFAISNTITKTIIIAVNRSAGNDTASIIADNGTWLKITEIARQTP